jgi:hypothetical protein
MNVTVTRMTVARVRCAAILSAHMYVVANVVSQETARHVLVSRWKIYLFLCWLTWKFIRLNHHTHTRNIDLRPNRVLGNRYLLLFYIIALLRNINLPKPYSTTRRLWCSKSQEKVCHMHNMHLINWFPRTLFGLSFSVLSFWTRFCN